MLQTILRKRSFRKIIEKHEGVIEFDTEPGKTMFRVSLPLWKMSESEFTEFKNEQNETKS